MSRPRRLTRRKFMGVAAAAAAVPLASCLRSSSPWRFLTESEARTLEAVCDRIIPPDEDPGAAWAGAVNYIDRQLMGPYRKFQKAYRGDIAGIDQTSRSKFGKPFGALPAEKQDEVLKMLEKGEAPGEIWKKRSSKRFFGMVVKHTMEGFYGDPRHGGNRDRVSWKMVRLPYPPVRGRNHYDLTRLAKS